MIFDFHNDLLTFESADGSFKIDYLRRNENVKIVLAIFTTGLNNAAEFIQNAISKYSLLFKDSLFALEDMNFVTCENISCIAALPLVYCTLAWKDDNVICGGHKGKIGLTGLGKALVKALNKKNIAVDTAHINNKSFYDVIENAKFVLNSHTCQNSIYSHSRNLDDNQIKLIIEKNGIVALTSVSQFMSDSPADLSGYVNQIDVFANKFGVSNVCIGTDFFGTEPLKGLTSYSDFENVKYSLSKLGYKKNEIEKIFYINAEEFLIKLKGNNE